MKAESYIGITGWKTPDEVQRGAQVFETVNLQEHVPMFGYLCSSKKLADSKLEGKRSPSLEDLAELVRYTPDWCLPMIHYHTLNRERLAEELRTVFEKDSLYEKCQAVQLNLAWPPIDQIEKVLRRFSDLRIVLQIPLQAMACQNVQEIAQQAKNYDGLVQHVLIDPSGGGRGLTIPDIPYVPLLLAVAESLPHARMGLAGGLKPSVLPTVHENVRKAYAEPYSIDTEAFFVRTADDRTFNFENVKEYVSTARENLENSV